MSETLLKLQEEYTDKVKRLKLLDAGIDHGDIDIYVKYLKSDAEEDLTHEVELLVADVRQQNTSQFADASNSGVWSPFK